MLTVLTQNEFGTQWAGQGERSSSTKKSRDRIKAGAIDVTVSLHFHNVFPFLHFLCLCVFVSLCSHRRPRSVLLTTPIILPTPPGASEAWRGRFSSICLAAFHWAFFFFFCPVFILNVFISFNFIFIIIKRLIDVVVKSDNLFDFAFYWLGALQLAISIEIFGVRLLEEIADFSVNQVRFEWGLLDGNGASPFEYTS